jgi:hypothetical protein
MTNEEREKAIFLDNLKNDGLPVYDEKGNITDYGNRAWEKVQRNQDQEKENRGTEYINTLSEELALEQQFWNGEITRKEYAIQRLAIEQNITYERAKQAHEIQNQTKSYQLMSDLLQQLGEASLSSLIDMAHELGEAFQDGSISANELGDALGNMMRRIIDMLPQLLLSAGLQAIIIGNLPLGLGLIAASGLSAFVAGLIPDASNDGAEDQLAKLQKIQEELSKLIDQQKSLEEYYFKKRQELNAKAVISVNDLIVTPQGTWSTHPDDYIIATKRPEELGSGTQMNVTIVNNVGAAVTTQQSVGANGVNDLLITLDQYMQRNVASGKWDGSLAAREARVRGRNIRTL